MTYQEDVSRRLADMVAQGMKVDVNTWQGHAMLTFKLIAFNPDVILPPEVIETIEALIAYSPDSVALNAIFVEAKLREKMPD